jgi:LacI family transcriptional regulator
MIDRSDMRVYDNPKTMATRIIDIAKLMNVSPATISLALNNKQGVSAELRERIVSLANEMGYKGVSGFKRRQTDSSTIRVLKIAKTGHIVNSSHNAFIADYLEGLEVQAKNSGYKLEVAFFNKVAIADIIASVVDAAVSGIVVLGTELDFDDMEQFNRLTLPLVFIDTFNPFSSSDCINMSNTDEIYKIVEHFYAYGHRDIGIVKSTYETRNLKVRETDFREALGYFSIPVREEFVFPVDSTFEQSFEDMARLLAAGQRPPSALFCVNDIMAYGCMKALKNMNYRIPEDVSIIGFDDLPSSAITEPPLTSIRVSKHQIGRRAMQHLVERISGDPNSMPERVLVGGQLIVRGSVRKMNADSA